MKKLLGGGHFFEGPRWHDGNWFVSDFYAHRVLKVTPDGQATTVVEVPNQPSGLGWMPDGSLLVVSMKDRKLMRLRPNGQFGVHADLMPYTGGWANDMVVDAKGRAYVGNIGFDFFNVAKPTTTTVVMVDTDGSCKVVADDVRMPNGSVITPDGKTLIVGETFGGGLLAFTIKPDGTLTDRRSWGQIAPAPSWESMQTLLQSEFSPDGCALDAEGCIWVADAFKHRICRVAPGGKILETLRTPEGDGIYACALGGKNGKTLLICAAPDHHHDKRAAKAEACLYTVELS